MARAGSKLSEAELKEWLSQQVAHFKVPRYIKFVNEFPMTVTGKIQKFVMRERMVTELNLQVAAQIETA
jgi:fatty-acyl-CoA synthase